MLKETWLIIYSDCNCRIFLICQEWICFRRTAEHIAAAVVIKRKKELRYTWLKYQLAWMTPHVAGKFWCGRKKRNCSTRDWKILVPSEKKELQHTWLENFGAVGKKQLQNTWMKNFGAVGKKGTAAHVAGEFWCRRKKTTAEHVTGKFWCGRKKTTAEHVNWKFWCGRKKRNCSTRGWKILVPSEKKELQNTWPGKFSCREKYVLHQTI